MRAVKSLAFGLLLTAVTSIQGAAAQAPAPLDLKAEVGEYYPHVNLYLGQMAQLVVRFQTSLSGYGVKPLSASLVRMDVLPFRLGDTPGGDNIRERFATSAEELIRAVRFKEQEKSGVDKRISILYLMSPCNQLSHDASADYFITICREPIVRPPDATYDGPPSGLPR